MRLAVVASHPIQYQAPLFRLLACRADLDVYFAYRASAEDQAVTGFGVPFEWDVDLLSGYHNAFLSDVTGRAGSGRPRARCQSRLPSFLAGGRYDSVLVMGWYLKYFRQAALACWLRGIPAMVRGDSQLLTPRSRTWEGVKRTIYPIALRAFSAALYVGQRSREYFGAYGYPSDRMFFSPHGVDTDWFATRATLDARNALRNRHGISNDETLLLFAGKLVEFKRPLDLIAAAARLRNGGKSVSVLVAGAGPLAEAMRRMAHERGVPLHSLGFQNQTKMPIAYAACDMLILPSTGRETWGLVANEALACGRPIIVSDAVGCAPDLAGDTSVGRIFPVGDDARLADAIARVISAPPTPFAIAQKSAAYGLDAACDGIIQAAIHASDRAHVGHF